MWPANDTAHVFAVDEPAAYTYYKIELTATTGAFQHDSFLILAGGAEEPDPLAVVRGNKQKVTVGTEVKFVTANAIVTGVLVDDKAIASENYTIDTDGTVTLSAAFIETLSTGKHTVTFEALGQTATAQFTLTTPATGDAAAIVIAAVAIMSLAGVAVVASKRRKIED